MNIAIINKIVRSMCIEVKAQETSPSDWQLLSEDQLLYEAVVCMFSSQTVFEVAAAMADRLNDLGFFELEQRESNPADYKARVVATLSEPLTIRVADGTTRSTRPRFKNRLASLLATTCGEIHGRGRSIRQLLISADTAKHARELLVQNVCGFGPKQASLFLRRIGYCSDLAVLDIHVLDYLRLVRGLTVHINRIGRLPAYEQVENEFREVAMEFGHSLGCVDLATWITMRVAKREAYI